MFALKARPASLASRRSHTTRRSSQIVRVAEFERKTAEKMPKISVPAVDGGETPLSILNDGADAFAELVALNKPKQSVNRPQKVRSGRRGDGDVGEKSTNERREEGENRIGEWLDGMPTTEGVMMMRATLTLFSSPQFPTSKPPPTGGRLPPEPDVRGLLSFLDQGVQGGGPRGDRHGPAGALVSEIVVSIPRLSFFSPCSLGPCLACVLLARGGGGALNAARNATCWGTSDLLGTPFISIEAALSAAERRKKIWTTRRRGKKREVPNPIPELKRGASRRAMPSRGGEKGGKTLRQTSPPSHPRPPPPIPPLPTGKKITGKPRPP